MDTNYEIERQKKMIETMITLYCKKNHKQSVMCDKCKELLEYLNNRLDKCPYKDNKHFCSNCHTPCYSKDRKEQIRKVMKFSGPRMIFYSPKIVFRHFIQRIKPIQHSKKGDKL